MNRMFAFSPRTYADQFASEGYVHVRDGLTPLFREKLSQQVDAFLEANRLKDFALGNKQQALYAFPEDADYLGELLDTVSAVCGLDRSRLVLSERHIKAYEADAVEAPLAHKDRLASEVAVGLSVTVPERSHLILYPYDEFGPNPFNSSAELRSSLLPDRTPEVLLGSARRVEIKDRAGDVIMFRGNAIWHYRSHPAETTMLYLKLNSFSCDPLGEDPRTTEVRRSTERLLSLQHAEFEKTIAYLGRRVDYVGRRYTRDWSEVITVVPWGGPAIAIEEKDLSVLRFADGRPVDAVLGSAGLLAAEGIPIVRRLARHGFIDLQAPE